MNNNTQHQNYNIRIPIYVSDSKLDDLIEIPFSEFTLSQDLLINNLISKVENHNQVKDIITSSKKHKTLTKNIEKVNYEKVKLGNDNALLLKITSFNSNLFDVFIEKETRITLSKNDKIGSEHYYTLIYPLIFGLEKREYKWIVLVYEDPNKDIKDIITAAKLVMNKVLGIIPVNIKLPDFIRRINSLKNNADLSMKFITTTIEDNDIDYEIRGFELESKITKISESKYKDVPISKISEIVQNKSFIDKFSKRILKISNGKQELKLEQEYLTEAKDKFKEIAEELFNYTNVVNSCDIESGNIYNTDYIVSKLHPVLLNYMSSFPND